MHGAASKPLEWTPRAFQAYAATVARMDEEDPLTAPAYCRFNHFAQSVVSQRLPPDSCEPRRCERFRIVISSEQGGGRMTRLRKNPQPDPR